MNRAIYEESKALAMELGFDLSDEGVNDAMQLPPVEKWEDDKKLSGFLPMWEKIDSAFKDENTKSDWHDELKTLAKTTRSASKGSIRGNLFEQAVEALALREGCSVEKDVEMYDIADESIDYVITLKSGKKLFLMCQIDLWGGGHQSNRAYKYLKNDNITSIVYNPYDLKKSRPGTKSYNTQQLLLQSHNCKRLMWLSDLKQLIREDNEKLSRL